MLCPISEQRLDNLEDKASKYLFIRKSHLEQASGIEVECFDDVVNVEMDAFC